MILPKLTIELVPRYCQFSNIRSTVTTNQWNKLRLNSYKNANYICEICGDNGLNQGFKHKLECHEIWAYDDKRKIQKLISLVSLCVLCHLTKHIGRASAIGKQAICFKHIAKVNNWNHKQIVEYLAESYTLQKNRANIKYKLDISILNEEPYMLNIDINAERIYIKSKYSKVKPKKTLIKKRFIKRPK